MFVLVTTYLLYRSLSISVFVIRSLVTYLSIAISVWSFIHRLLVPDYTISVMQRRCTGRLSLAISVSVIHSLVAYYIGHLLYRYGSFMAGVVL